MSRDISKLVREHLTPEGRLYLAPEIPKRKLQNARAIHAAHLPDGVDVLVLYDDTLFGGASDGFLLCEDRICWKNLGEEARCTFWSALDPATVTAAERELQLGGGRVQMFMHHNLIPKVAKLIASLATGGEGIEIAPGGLTQSSLLRLARRRLGEHDDVFYAPVIPEHKLLTALETHEDSLAGEAPAVLLDDTVFGSAEEGFLLTPTRIAWKNISESPQSLTFAELDPATIICAPGGVKLNGRSLELTNKEELGRSLALLLRDLARHARGETVYVESSPHKPAPADLTDHLIEEPNEHVGDDLSADLIEEPGHHEHVGDDLSADLIDADLEVPYIHSHHHPDDRDPSTQDLLAEEANAALDSEDPLADLMAQTRALSGNDWTCARCQSKNKRSARTCHWCSSPCPS